MQAVTVIAPLHGQAVTHTFIDADAEERDGCLFVRDNGAIVERFDMRRVWVWFAEDLP